MREPSLPPADYVVDPDGVFGAARSSLYRKTKNLSVKLRFLVLERKTRLELATPTLARSCSTD